MSISVKCRLVDELCGWYLWKQRMVANHHRIVNDIEVRDLQTRNGILNVIYYYDGAMGSLDEESPDFLGYLPSSTLKVNCLTHGGECDSLDNPNYYNSFTFGWGY